MIIFFWFLLIDGSLRMNPSQFSRAGRMSGGGLSLLADLTQDGIVPLRTRWGQAAFRRSDGSDQQSRLFAVRGPLAVISRFKRQIVRNQSELALCRRSFALRLRRVSGSGAACATSSGVRTGKTRKLL
jgi:hypothetical protein